MMRVNESHKQFLESKGVLLPEGHKYIPIAQDAQPQLSTAPNSGVLSIFTTYYDPKVINILFAVMAAIRVAGAEVKKGDWTDVALAFNVVEPTGVVASYDDYSTNGVANANTNYPQRQPYLYQVITQWGELELARMSLQRLDWASIKDSASIFTLNKFQNLSYFFGVEGLQNYGLLNDPNLNPFIPVAVPWSAKTALEIYNDFVLLFTDLSNNAQGNVDPSTPMSLGVSQYGLAQLTRTNDFFNKTALIMIKEQFPNLEVIDAPEFATTSGQVARLKAINIGEQMTEEVSYNVKLRSGPVVIDLSHYKQKKSQGTNGALIYRPALISALLGV